MDVVASAQPTILPGSYSESTIIVYANASAMQLVVIFCFSKHISHNSFTLGIPQRVWLQRKPTSGIFAYVESSYDLGYLQTIFEKVALHS
jgi:hypothetical protein